MTTEIFRSEEGARLLRERYRATLSGWPVPAEELTVPTPEGETFVLASGSTESPPLVLLHGSGGNATQWITGIGELARDFRVYAVDIIGEQGLSAPSRPPVGSDRYAVWLDAVLDGLGVDSAAFMGISLGSWLSLDYGMRRPNRVRRLALSCPPGLGPNKKGYLLKALVLGGLGRWGQRRMVAGMLGPGLAALSPSQREALVEEVSLVSGNYRYRSGDLPVFDDEALRGLTMPVHVLAGERDVMWDSAVTARRFAALVPRARVHILPDVGHYIPTGSGAEIEFLTAEGPA